jgi:hypothetical protein
VTVFYRGPRARITHEVIETWCPTYRSFRIDELYSVHIAEAGSRAGPPGTRLFAGTAVALLFVMVPVLNRTAAWLAGLALAMSVLIAGACLRIRPQEPHELRALHRAQLVLLFQSADPREFGQVGRALLRALEQSRDV